MVGSFMPLTLIVTVRPASVLTRKLSLVLVAGPAGDRLREVGHVVQDGLATKLLVTAVAVDLQCGDALDRGVHRDEVAVLAGRELLLKALVLDELGEVGDRWRAVNEVERRAALLRRGGAKDEWRGKRR